MLPSGALGTMLIAPGQCFREKVEVVFDHRRLIVESARILVRNKQFVGLKRKPCH